MLLVLLAARAVSHDVVVASVCWVPGAVLRSITCFALCRALSQAGMFAGVASCNCVARVRGTKEDYWFQTLCDFGWSGELKWLQGLVRFLLRNDFDNRSQLVKAQHPSEWAHAKQLTVGELQLIAKLCPISPVCRGGCSVASRKRKRRAHCSCCCSFVRVLWAAQAPD